MNRWHSIGPRQERLLWAADDVRWLTTTEIAARAEVLRVPDLSKSSLEPLARRGALEEPTGRRAPAAPRVWRRTEHGRRVLWRRDRARAPELLPPAHRPLYREFARRDFGYLGTLSVGFAGDPTSENAGWVFELTLAVPCARSGIRTSVVNRKRYSPSTLLAGAVFDVERVVEEVVGELWRSFWAHEFVEFYRIDGKRARDPHPAED